MDRIKQRDPNAIGEKNAIAPWKYCTVELQKIWDKKSNIL
jgi:hypothetical protein